MTRTTWIAAAVATALLPLSACTGFEASESLCSKGEVPAWAIGTIYGGECVPAGHQPPDPAYALYPPGRVPRWDVAPSTYRYLNGAGQDRYHVSPESPDYPWKADLYAAYPAMDCKNATRVIAVIPFRAVRPSAPTVTASLLALRDPAGDLCLAVRGSSSGLHQHATVTLRAALAAAPFSDAEVWTQHGDDFTGRQRLRVGVHQCIPFTALITLVRNSGAYRYTARGPVRPRCS